MSNNTDNPIPKMTNNTDTILTINQQANSRLSIYLDSIHVLHSLERVTFVLECLQTKILAVIVITSLLQKLRMNCFITEICCEFGSEGSYPLLR